MQQLGALDNLMLDGEPPNLPLHMSAVMIYDTRSRRGAARLRDTFRERFEGSVVTRFPILRCKAERLPLHVDRAYWVEDPEFSQAHHITHVALPAGKDWQALYELFGEFHAQPLNTARPLWQAMFVEGLDQLEGIPRGACAIFLKIHHAVFDGMGAIRLVNSFHNLSPDPDAPALADSMADAGAPADFTRPSLLAKYGRAWWHGVERPVDLAASLLKLTPALWTSRKTGDQGAAPLPPATLFNQPVAADRVVGHVRMEMSLLRRLEKSFGCTINDIAVCVIAGAMRGFLSEKDALPDADLCALMPVDIRRESEESVVGTHVSVARIPLHTDVAAGVERLKMVHAETSRGKRQSRRTESLAALDLLDEIHPAVLLWVGDWLVSSGHLAELPQFVNTVVTNVPGLARDAYIGKAKLVDYLGFGPLAPGIGLFHTVSSTRRRVNISFLSTQACVGDGADYRCWLERSWEELSAP